jgi:hypothetical protein
MPPKLSPTPKGIFNGWWPIYDYGTLLAWKRNGEAASLGDDYELLRASRDHAEAVIRVHRVATLDEYLATVGAYRGLAKRHSFSSETFDHTLTCLLRGQSRDYLDARGAIVSQPSAFRSGWLAAEYLDLEGDTTLAREWRQWARVIRQVMDIADQSGPAPGERTPR